MKKQFFRVKQIVDQTVAGAEQSEAFNEDVQLAEKHIEQLKQTCGLTSKKIGSLLSKNEGTHEKRLKKIPESAIGNTMFECGANLGEKSILRELLLECGQLGTKLGWEMLAHEVELEKAVVEPLTSVENEAYNIAKSRKTLNKLILDMDSARTRYRNAQKPGNSGINPAKLNGIREELEEAQQKVEQSRDALAADIYTLLSREPEFAKVICTYAESQRRYHAAALKVLNEYIPNLENKWKAHVHKPVFGYDLDDHLRTSGRTIAHPIEICVITLFETGLDEEGVFRIAGGSSKVRKFRAALDANVADLGFALELRDVHTVAGVLKSYLRELPDPMLSAALYNDWMNAIKITDAENRFNALKEVLKNLPENRLQNTRYLMKFLHELSRHQENNKMTSQNLAIVLAPCLIWSPNSNDTLTLNMSLANMHSAIIEHLITFADRFFPGEIDYYATYSKLFYAQMFLPPSPLNGGFTDRDEADSKEARKTHQRIGSNEGLADHRRSTPFPLSVATNTDATVLGSPRPVLRKKNKPAPAVPEPPGVINQMPKTSPSSKTPEREEKKLPGENSGGTPSAPAERPSLPPTGPDPKRYSAMPSTVDRPKPALAPRPSLNMPSASSHQLPNQTPAPIGFEAIETELRRHGSVRTPARPTLTHVHAHAHKSDDESIELRKPATHKRISSMDNVLASQGAVTHHPNAVNVFGGLPPPTPLDRTKLEGEKPRPLIPGRPSVTKLQVTQNAIPDNQPEEKHVNVERVQPVTVAKQQVSVVHLNTSSSPLNLNLADHSDIEFADCEETVNKPTTVGASNQATETIKREKPPKPERPEKPERLSHPSSVESNNNTTGNKAECGTAVEEDRQKENHGNSPPTASSQFGSLPRPAPRSQPPAPPVKPRTSVNDIDGDSTSF